jgi:hypothetical protein
MDQELIQSNIYWSTCRKYGFTISSVKSSELHKEVIHDLERDHRTNEILVMQQICDRVQKSVINWSFFWGSDGGMYSISGCDIWV